MGDRVYEILRKRIILLHYAPGEVMAARTIATELGVSPTPIREALIRLEMEGLVRRHPNRGIHVSEIGLHDLRDVVEVRSHLLELIARLAARRASLQEIRNLERIAEAVERSPSRTRKVYLDLQFHNTLMACCKNNMLFRTVETMDYQVRRLWAYISADEAHLQRMPSQFAAIARALRDRDEEAAVKALHGHSADFFEAVRTAIGETMSGGGS